MSDPALKSYQIGEEDPLFADNHLTLIRWILASMVAVSHSWLLARGERLFSLFDQSLGDLAVNGFFIVSGMLIAKSLHMTANIRNYAVSRTLRIMPALMVVSLSFPLFFSPLFSIPGGLEKIIAWENWAYVLRVWTLGDPENAPGGIFGNNYFADFNTPLWTIRIEIVAYIGAAFLFFSKLARDRTRIFGLAVMAALAYAAILYEPHLPLPAIAEELLRLGSCFLLGMLFFYAPRLRGLGWRGVGAGAFLSIVLSQTVLAPICVNITLAFLIMTVGLPSRPTRRIVKLPDYSYGIYIWHCPVMQALIFVDPDISPLTVLALSAPIFITLAALSWIFVEKPALTLKRRAWRTPTSQVSVE